MDKHDKGKRSSSFLEKFSTFRGKDKEKKPKVPQYRPPSIEENAIFGDDLSDKEIDAKFEQMLDDMNLTEEKKAPLRQKDMKQKKAMLMMQVKGNMQNRGKVDTSVGFTQALMNPELRGEKRLDLLESLRVALTSNPVSWVTEFGSKGLNAILRNLTYCYDNKSERRSVQECVKCLKAFSNNKFGLTEIINHEEAMTILARSVDTKDPPSMLEAVHLVAAICLVPPDGHNNALEGITVCGEIRGQERFMQIIQGLSMDDTGIKVACMQLINAIVSTPDDLDFRMHLRNEMMRTGLHDVIGELERIPKKKKVPTATLR